MKKGLSMIERWTVVLTVFFLVFGLSTAQARTAEEKCQFKRAVAKANYGRCVQKWLAGCYGGRCPSGAKMGRCVSKYVSTWPRLQALSGTACDAPRFVDNGATVTDNLTGLIWEKKTTDGSVHDVSNTYDWSGLDLDESDEDGTAFTVFLATLNAVELFDGAAGWRMPTLSELLTIRLEPVGPRCSTEPCIDPIFGPTATAPQYASSGNPTQPRAVWLVLFNDFPGGFNLGPSSVVEYPIRAVRAGW